MEIIIPAKAQFFLVSTALTIKKGVVNWPFLVLPAKVNNFPS